MCLPVSSMTQSFDLLCLPVSLFGGSFTDIVWFVCDKVPVCQGFLVLVP